MLSGAKRIKKTCRVVYCTAGLFFFINPFVRLQKLVFWMRHTELRLSVQDFVRQQLIPLHLFQYYPDSLLQCCIQHRGMYG